MKTLLISLSVLIIVGVVWRSAARAGQEPPPLEISDDDPEMKAAMKKAQETISEFRRLYKEHADGAMVKVSFVTSSGRTEYLGADVLELGKDDIKVRITTPPVTHKGKLEPVQTFAIGNVVDWVIVMPGDKRKGGFTMRVMFKKAREQWGKLPPDVAAEEKKYE
jgi:uncharacterized protein YegJ (DUF2314 family)